LVGSEQRVQYNQETELWPLSFTHPRKKLETVHRKFQRRLSSISWTVEGKARNEEVNLWTKYETMHDTSRLGDLGVLGEV